MTDCTCCEWDGRGRSICGCECPIHPIDDKFQAVIWQHTLIKNVLDVQLKEKLMSDDDSIRRDIVLQVARQIFLQSLRIESAKITYAAPEHCLSVGEIWATAQIAYCEKFEGSYE